MTLPRRRSVLSLAAVAAALTSLAACGSAASPTSGRPTTARPTTARPTTASPKTASPATTPPGIVSVPGVDPLPSPITRLKNGVCLAIRHRVPPLPASAAGESIRPSLVTVDPDPTGVTAIWLPGMNQRLCRWSVTTSGRAVARRLASDVRSAPRFPPLGTGCPMDDASGVALYFRYGAEHAVEYVAVGLRGCVQVTAPRQYPRRATPALLRDLGRLAPRPWNSTVQGG